MAVCVIDTGTALAIAPGETAPACSQFVLMQAGEPTAADIFTVPLAADLQDLWMVGFSLPLIVYLAAWAFGSVVNFINSRGS